MKNFLMLIGGIILMFASSLFGGLLLMKFYEWCLTPLGDCFNYTFPVIDYGLFVMADVGLALLKYKPLGEETECVDGFKLAFKILTGKASLLFMLWIFKLIIL